METLIRTMLVEDDADFIFLIRQMLESESDLQLVGCARDRSEAVQMAVSLKPDIVLMDLNLSSTGLDGIDASRDIRRLTSAKVIILTSFEDPKTVIEASKKSFASGYVFKSQFTLIPDCIRETHGGHTPQEYLIRSLMLSQLSPAELAVFNSMVGVEVQVLSSQKTIANQKTNIFKKLGVKSQSELVHIFQSMVR